MTIVLYQYNIMYSENFDLWQEQDRKKRVGLGPETLGNAPLFGSNTT
jgi:hypothetical protein